MKMFTSWATEKTEGCVGQGAPADSVQSQGSGRERRGGEKRAGWEGKCRDGGGGQGEAGRGAVQVLSRTSAVLSSGCCHGGELLAGCLHTLSVEQQRSSQCLLSIYSVTLWQRLITLSVQPASHAPSQPTAELYPSVMGTGVVEMAEKQK